MTFSYRHTASFGKRTEYFVLAQMLKERLDCYVPLVDDNGIDVVIKKEDNTFIMVQIKARSSDVKEGHAALFAGLHHQERENYFYVFYSERMQDNIKEPFYWILSSDELIKEANKNKTGKNKGKMNICFNGYKTNKTTGQKEEYKKCKFQKYVCTNFKKILQEE